MHIRDFKIGFSYKVIRSFNQGETLFAEGLILKVVDIAWSRYDSANVYTLSIKEGGGKTISLWLADDASEPEELKNFEALPLRSKYFRETK